MQSVLLHNLPTLLIEDDQLTREACHAYLSSLGLVVQCAETYEQALCVINEKIMTFRLVVTDLSLRHDNKRPLRKANAVGLGLIRRVKQLSPTTPVVVWTAYPDQIANVLDLVLQGYRGLACVPKGNTVDILYDAIVRVLDGDVIFEVSSSGTSSMQELFLSLLEPEAAKAVVHLSDKIALLPPRHREVANLLACTTEVIASRLCLSQHTIHNYRNLIYGRLGLIDDRQDIQRDVLIVLAILLSRLHATDYDA